MQIHYYGVRGSQPVANPVYARYGGNTSCFCVDGPSDEILIIDAGSGIRTLGNTLPDAGICNLILSHGHWDHIMGLPFFRPLFHPSWIVNLYLPEGMQHLLSHLMDGVVFPVRREDLPATVKLHTFQPGDHLHLSGIAIDTFSMPHPGGCVGMRLTAEGSVLAISNDCELPESGDIPPQVLDLLRNADIAVVDGQYSLAQLSTRKGWGHSARESWIEPALKMGVKQLVFTHHDIDTVDVDLDRALLELRKEHMHGLILDMAREGMTDSLGPSVVPKEHHMDSKRLDWLTNVAQELTRFDDISATLDRILTEARKVSNADAGTVYLLENEKLVFSYTHNDTLFPVETAYKYAYANSTLPLSDASIAGYCATHRILVNIPDVQHIPETASYTFNDSFDKRTGYKTVSVLALPIEGRGGRLLGVIQLINSMDEHGPVPFSAEMENYLVFLGVQAVSALERSLLVRNMAYNMQKMAAFNDPLETAPHAERVGAIAAEVYQRWAEKRQIPIDTRRAVRAHLRLAAMLHDLGKVAIPHEIIKKNAKLSEEEFTIVKTHCIEGARLFQGASLEVDIMARDIALHHHQKWNGTGYTGTPDVPALAGEEIPLTARITAVADVFDALVSVRCYKPKWPWDKAVETLIHDSGSHFDPEVVDAFLEIQDIIHLIYERYPDVQHPEIV